MLKRLVLISITSYLGGDENAADVGALLTTIRLDDRTKRLSWIAAGELGDNDFGLTIPPPLLLRSDQVIE